MGDISDEQWSVISSLLPPERGRWARPAHDNRRCLNGILWILRNGLPWREMPQRYGKWNSVYVRFRRWGEQGVWQTLFEPLVRLGLTQDWEPLPESSTVKPGGQSGGPIKISTREELVEAAKLRRAELGIELFGQPTTEPKLQSKPKREKKAAPLRAKQHVVSNSKLDTKLPKEARGGADPALRGAVRRKAQRTDWDAYRDINDPERMRRRFEQLLRRIKVHRPKA